MAEYGTIAEIVDTETGEAHPPEQAWEIEVIERDLAEDLGDLGGREPFVANARVRVTEPDGSSWEGLTILDD